MLLLVLASAAPLGSESPGVKTIFYFPNFWGSPNLEGQAPIYVPQEQGGPVFPSGTGFPFRRLLRLAELHWIYSNPPPHDSILVLLITSTRTAQKTQLPKSYIFASMNVCSHFLAIVVVYRDVTSQRLLYSCLFQCCYLATFLYALLLP
jgi:hypothetical protein